MALKKYKPVTPSQRYTTIHNSRDISDTSPEKSLLVAKRGTGGRNSNGRITSRGRGGGHKRAYRIIDFKRDKFGIPARVADIQYDPNRSANIALLFYADGEKRYIICPNGLKKDDAVMSGPDSEFKIGSALPMGSIPLGTFIHNIEMKPGKGGQLVRGAGGAAQLMARDEKYAQVKLPSGEVRQVLVICYATIGQVGNLEHMNISLGKAGRSRWLGKRPISRGVVRNPVDHPMGGGEGKSSGGRHPCSPWGQLAKGLKTRKKKKASNKFIVKKRK